MQKKNKHNRLVIYLILINLKNSIIKNSDRNPSFSILINYISIPIAFKMFWLESPMIEHINGFF